MNKKVYVGWPDFPNRVKASEQEIRGTIETNVAAAMQVAASEREASTIAHALQSVDNSTPLEATRYTFGYGAEVRHGAKLLDSVQVLGLRDAIDKIHREQQEGCNSVEFSVPGNGILPADLIVRKEDWTAYGFAIMEDIKWGPLMSSTPTANPSARPKHRITPRRIAELLALTTNAQIGLDDHSLVTFGPVEQNLLKGICSRQEKRSISLPNDLSFHLTRPSQKEIYEWHLRVNAWEDDFASAESALGVLASEASKGILSWRRHDDEKEIMALGRCLESMWAPGERRNKRTKIHTGCRSWMLERHQSEAEIKAMIELIDRFYNEQRNVLAHEATGCNLSTDIERAHLNAKMLGIIEDYLWWNLTREMTQSKPTIISRSENGNSHTVLWPQMWCHWKDKGLTVDEIRRLWA